jgi:hypothetical protein
MEVDGDDKVDWWSYLDAHSLARFRYRGLRHVGQASASQTSQTGTLADKSEYRRAIHQNHETWYVDTLWTRLYE